MSPQLLSRAQINDVAWNQCVKRSPQRVMYGYTWYLDCVAWRWAGLVIPGKAGAYQAVMPVPLRRKFGRWVVHQPLFCQFLGVFAQGDAPDVLPFYEAMQQHFRYCSVYATPQHPPDLPGLQIYPYYTHVLDLSPGYDVIRQGYSRDRQLNLRRAEAAHWTVTEEENIEPLLQLFRCNHADSIPGTVANWAYDQLRTLYAALHKRGLITLRYTRRAGSIEAGALFVQEGNRIVYLFNAATESGRRGNARTLLIDQLLQEKAGQPLLFDFESPEKPSIAGFYQSFGAVAQPYWTVRYSRLSPLEKGIQQFIRRWRS
ncbi:hypothetical protein GCM10023189_29930 [Nibrella saemangeumensis]|uniref:BioF2-like acetyltransferase domain-containing protein n=1 Tax=Nibrella saemangeumensis TaxID=1084526 RepID=A0ABP8N162_9BACT